MKNHPILPYALLAAALLFGGCAGTSTSTLPYGVGGTVVGGGVGALVGSLISDGDVAASAGLGAAIGLGTGLIVGAVLDSREAEKSEAMRAELVTNQEAIILQDRELQDAYREVGEESQRQEIDDRQHEKIYDGQTLGNYRR